MVQSMEVPSPARSGNAGRWFAAAVVLVVLTEQSALGIQLVTPALLGIGKAYGTTDVIWVITIFTLMGAAATPIVGKLGDRWGKRRVLAMTAAISLGGSVLAALAPNFGLLLVGRALMGISMAFLPVSVALIRDVFPDNFRAISIGMATNGIGFVTLGGPFLAGFLIDNFGVTSLFWFNAALSLTGAIGILLLVPETHIRNTAPLDLLGAVWLVVGLLTLMFGVSQLKNWSFLDLRSLLFVGGGLVLLVCWWRYEARIDHPFIDTSSMASRPIASVVIVYSLFKTGIIVGAAYLPTMLMTPRELTGGEYGFGLTASGVALYLIPAGLLTVASGVLVGVMSRRVHPRTFLRAGCLIMAAGTTIIALLRTEPWMPILGWGLAGIGAMVYAAGPTLLMRVSPVATRGTTAGMMAAISGVVASVFAQIAGLVLARNTLDVVDGLPIYSGEGIALAFLLPSAAGIAGFLIAYAVPKADDALETEETLRDLEYK